METQELQHQLQVMQAETEKERKGRQQAQEKNIELTRKIESMMVHNGISVDGTGTLAQGWGVTRRTKCLRS